MPLLILRVIGKRLLKKGKKSIKSSKLLTKSKRKYSVFTNPKLRYKVNKSYLQAMKPYYLAKRYNWHNWTGNINNPTVADPLKPESATDLSAIITGAVEDGKKVRVAGQGHCQSPAVINSDTTDTILIDLSCYGKGQGQGGADDYYEMVDDTTVRVNAGVREDDLDEFLNGQSLALPTVTAGGFFSLGGMTSIDVHGSTVNSGIFAESVVSFDVMGPRGDIVTISNETELDFYRVNLGALGIVTSMNITVEERKSVELTQLGKTATSADEFANKFSEVLANNQRVEAFFNPYDIPLLHNYHIACWNLNDTTNTTDLEPINACNIPDKGAETYPRLTFASSQVGTEDDASSAALIAISGSQSILNEAAKNNQLLWLTDKIVKCMFMSYFIPIGDISNSDNLKIAWEAMDIVKQANKDFTYGFRVAAPMEFRFIKGGKTKLAGTHSDGEDQWFVNLDLLGYLFDDDVENNQKLYQYFAYVESQWIGNQFNGIPHLGKMYGFYDPDSTGPQTSGPYNNNFFRHLRSLRQDRVDEFNAFRTGKDLNVFSNDYVNAIVGELV